MEKELNIAAILKEKPDGIILFDRLRGIPVYFSSSEDDAVYCYPNKESNSYFFYDEYGKYESNEDAIQILVPSKEMQDWSKFAWKKGDVLKDQYGHFCIFEEWANKDYTKFNASYANSKYGDRYYSKLPNAETMEYKKVCEEASVRHIKEIEKNLDGKLNLSTLEIEQPKQKFKDGDVVLFYNGNGCYDTIAIIKEQGDEISKVYAFLEIPIMKLYLNIEKFYVYTRMARLATDSEKQQLFSALEKEGKVWNSETKQIEDLPKKCEFEPFQKVMIRSYEENEWRADFFSYYDEKSNLFPYVCVGSIGSVCLPYNDSTKHLLGTTDEWKGGEG